MSYYVAIDKSADGVHVAVLDATFRGAQLVSLSTVEYVEGEDDASLWKRVREVLPEHVDTLCFLVNPMQSSTRVLSFPFGDVRKVETALEFELENQIPYDIENIVSTHQTVFKTEQHTDVMVSYVPKTYMDETLGLLKSVSLEPRVMPLYGVSLGECVPHEKVFKAVLWLGPLFSCFTLVCDGVVYYTRVIRADVSKQQMSVLCAGIASALRTLPELWAPVEIKVLYAGDVLEGFEGLCAEYVGCAVVPMGVADILGDVTHALTELPGKYVPVISAVVSLVRKARSVAMDFRRGAYAYQGDFHVYRDSAVRVGVGCAIVLLLSFMASWVKYGVAVSEEKKINAAFCEVTRKIVGREICDSTAALATLRQSPGAAEGVYIPPYSVTAMFEMMSRMVGTDIDVHFEELDMRVGGREGDAEEKISGKGEAASFETTEQLAAALKKDVCVTDVEISKQRKSKNAGRVEFNILVKMHCPAGTMPGSKSAQNQAPQQPVFME